MEQTRQQQLLNNMIKDSDISNIQKYFKEVLELRGFNDQRASDKILLLIEEVGELAKAVRKEVSSLGIDYDQINNYGVVENEIADVFIVLISLCNLLDIDLFDAVVKKESINVKRRWQ